MECNNEVAMETTGKRQCWKSRCRPADLLFKDENVVSSHIGTEISPVLDFLHTNVDFLNTNLDFLNTNLDFMHTNEGIPSTPCISLPSYVNKRPSEVVLLQWKIKQRLNYSLFSYKAANEHSSGNIGNYSSLRTTKSQTCAPSLICEDQWRGLIVDYRHRKNDKF